MFAPLKTIRALAPGDEDRRLLAESLVASQRREMARDDFTDLIVEKRWGWEYEVFRNAHSTLWALHFNGQGGMSVHCHPSCDTALLVIYGEVHVEGLRTSWRMSSGEGLLIPRGTYHKLLGSTDAVLIESLQPSLRHDLIRHITASTVNRPAANSYLSDATLSRLEATFCWQLPHAVGKYAPSKFSALELPNGTRAVCAFGPASYQTQTLIDLGAIPLAFFDVSGVSDSLSYSIPDPNPGDEDTEFVSFSLIRSRIASLPK